MRKIFYLLTILLCSFHAFGQYALRGIVKDAVTHQPVSGATVFIPHSAAATSTDEEGKFVLMSNKDFSDIVISSLGYSKLLITAEDKTEVVTFELQPSGTSLKPVEVLGIKKAESVNTLTLEDLRRFSGLNLQDALNTMPGVNMASRSPWGGQHIIIRGYYPSADNGRSNGENFAGLGYQLYINNVPVTDATGTTVMDDIDFYTLGKVEVIKGPSPLYGSYIAGAVNLYTQRPAPNQSSVQQDVIGGSYGLFRTNTTLQSSTDKTDLWINYGHQTYNGFRPNDASQKDYVSFTSNSYVSSKQTISTYFSYNHSNEQLAGEIDSADFYGRKAISDSNYAGNHSHADIESFRAGITDNYKFNSHFSNMTTAFATGSDLNQAYAHGYTKDENLNFGGRTAFMYDTKGRHISVNGVLGASFEKTNQTAQGNFILPFVSPPFTPATKFNIPSDVQNYAMNYNIFTQWTFSLPSQISLTVGASLNFVEFGTQNLIDSLSNIYTNDPTLVKSFKPSFTPDASLIKVFNNNISVYASVATGYAPPTISQMTNTYGQVDPYLHPERAIQYEIGTKGSLLKDKKLSYQLALFDMDIYGRLVQETSDANTFYTNIGEQRNLGAELYLSYAAINDSRSFISLVRPWASYTYSHFTYQDFKTHGTANNGADTILANYSGNKVAEVAPNMLNIGVDVGTKYGFYLSATYRYMDKAPVTFDDAHYMKSYNLLSARIGYKHQFGKHFGADVFAGADNLLGSTYYNFIFVGQNIQELAQGNDPYVKGGGGDGYILPAPYKATFYGGASLKYTF